MESVLCDSPSKNTLIHEAVNYAKSPSAFSTPVRNNEKNHRQNGFTSNLNGFNLLPSHITPPSGLTKFIARNPFEADLTNRLHLSVISPTVFTKVPSSVHQDSPGFSWSVDELALIQPAKIEEFPVQQMHSTDPDLELTAQAAINKFFSHKEIIPSPWNTNRKVVVESSQMLTPSRPQQDLNVIKETPKNKKDSWSQTVLTLPPTLPKSVEEALKPYFTFNQDQSVDSDDANSSNNSSLRRKLFFNNDDCTDDEDDSSFCFSPSKGNGSMIRQSSPPQSGMLVHGTPLRGQTFGLERTHGTPYASNVSPPNMSPIRSGDMSCQSVRSRFQFAARLDFTTDMSIDQSMKDDRELKKLEDIEHETNTSLIRCNILNDNPQAREENYEEVLNVTAEMISRECTPLKNSKPLYLRAPSKETHEESKFKPDNTILCNSYMGQTSDCTSAQDTGYQTNSMSNITGNNTENSIAPITKSFDWSKKVLSNVEEIRLSDWQNNIKSMFSSTPSKHSRQRENIF